MSYNTAVDFFKLADTDSSGYLSYQELNAVLAKAGYKQKDIQNFFKYCDTSGDQKISLEEFLVAMGEQPGVSHKEAAMRRVFRSFDRDGNGQIDRAELSTAMKEMGKDFTDDEIKRMIACCDDDKSGTISYEEFIEHVFKTCDS